MEKKEKGVRPHKVVSRLENIKHEEEKKKKRRKRRGEGGEENGSSEELATLVQYKAVL